MRRHRRPSRVLVAGLGFVLATAALIAVPRAVPPAAGALPPLPRSEEFTTRPVISGLSDPIAVRFTDTGEVFVAERGGVIKAFDSLSDDTPTVVIDISDRVNYVSNARGLMGFEVDPNWPDEPNLWLWYTVDAPPGEEPPFWNDACPAPNGGNDLHPDGCTVGGTLLRLELDPDDDPRTAFPEKYQVIKHSNLIETGFCEQFGHSVGGVVYGRDGALYVGAGDGASWEMADYGQLGGSAPDSVTPRNPCGDPPGGVGAAADPTTSEGGSLRSQDLMTSGDPLGINGAMLRIHPTTGAALPDNPLFGGDPGDDRHIATGLRSPFRFTQRPGTDELWIGDVGWNTWEEIDVIRQPTAAPPPNFGWPCHEGGTTNPGWKELGNQLCSRVYGEVDMTEPAYAYRHHEAPGTIPGNPQPGDCAADVISGIAFYPGGGTYPAEYDGAVFFGDAWGGCIWAMRLDQAGIPDPSSVAVVARGIVLADLQAGPEGDLYYVDNAQGTVGRLRFDALACPLDDSFEQNDAPPSARPLASDTSVDGIACPGDDDWFGVTLGDGETLSEILTFDPSAGGLELSIHSSDGTLWRSSTSGSGTAVVHVPPEGPRNARIRIRGVAGASNTYSLRSVICTDDTLGNGDQDHAATLGTPPTSGMACAAETDWFSFDAIAGEVVRVIASYPIERGGLFLDVRSLAPRPPEPQPAPYYADSEGRRIHTAFVTRSGRHHATVQTGDAFGGTPYAISARADDAMGACVQLPSRGDAFEQNLDRSRATAPGPWPRKASICGQATWFPKIVDLDHYAVDAIAGQPITALIEFARSAGDLELRLIDGSGDVTDPDAGTVLATGAATSGGAALSYVPAATGRLFLQVRGSGPDVTNDYMLYASTETVVEDLQPGQRATTDPEDDGASSADPVETSVIVPAPFAGLVTLREAADGTSTSGYELLGHRVVVSAPAGTASSPLVIEFTIDPSTVPAGTDLATIDVLRNGVRVPTCTATSGAAAPDPCVASRHTTAGGDLVLRVLTSRASDWQFGVSTGPTTGLPGGGSGGGATPAPDPVALTGPVGGTARSPVPTGAATGAAPGPSPTRSGLVRNGIDAVSQASTGLTLIAFGAILLFIARRTSHREAR